MHMFGIFCNAHTVPSYTVQVMSELKLQYDWSQLFATVE